MKATRACAPPTAVGSTLGFPRSRPSLTRKTCSTARRTSRRGSLAERPGPVWRVLFRHLGARAAEFFRKILELRQAVAQVQHRLAVVHVQARLERQVGNDRGIDVGQAERRMLGA